MTTHLYIPGQLPDFIRSDYPLFVEFLQEYYRWLDKEYNNKKLSEIIDIDTTTQEYVDKIRRQLDVYGITSGKENQRFVLQKIKEIYSAKGTEAGIKVFLRLVFNKNSEVFYPNDIVLEPSASKWVRPCSVLGRFEVYPRDLDNTIMTIETEQGHSIDVCALKFVQRKSSIFEIFIDKIIDKDLTPTWLIFSDGTKVRAQKTTKRVSVLNGGSGYRKGQVFRIDSYGGVGTVVKIKRVDRNGGVVSVEIIEYGYGYNGKFIAHLPSPKSQEGSSFSSSISGNSISATNLDLVSIASDIGIAVSNDYGSINGIDGYFSDPSYVGKVLSEIVGNAEPGSCSLMVEIGGVAQYPGRYENDGKLLGVAVLHDSDRFQRFSYEVRSEENFEHFKNVLLQLLHPAGHKLFGDYLLKMSMHVSPEMSFSYNRFVKTGRGESNISIEDQFSIVKDFRRSFSDSVRLDDMIFGLSNQGEEPDVINVQDIIVKNVTRNLNSSMSISDNISILRTKEIEDTIQVSDETSKDITTSFQDDFYVDEELESNITTPGVDLVELSDSVLIKKVSSKTIDNQVAISEETKLKIEKALNENLEISEDLSIFVNSIPV